MEALSLEGKQNTKKNCLCHFSDGIVGFYCYYEVPIYFFMIQDPGITFFLTLCPAL